jgi:excisionase family DNA binding protein
VAESLLQVYVGLIQSDGQRGSVSVPLRPRGKYQRFANSSGHRTRKGAFPVPTPAPLAYTPQQAADAIGVTRQTIYNLIERGDLRRFKVGRCTRIPAADVHALVGYEGCDTA